MITPPPSTSPTGGPFQIVLIGSFGHSGDPVYRVHQPAAALAALEGVVVHELHPNARDRDQAAIAADLLVLVMGMDVELLRLVHQRRLLGRPTVIEVNDWVPGVQRCNPVNANWSDPRAWGLLSQLCHHCDAVQVSSTGLLHRLGPLARQVRLVGNHLPHVPPLQARPDGPLRLGWGGSAGHLEDIAAIAPALLGWLKRHRHVRLEVMGDPVFRELFADAAPHQFIFHPGGSMEHYLRWLEGLHIGLAPLLPSDYNACRSDVKFLEYASRGVLPVLQRSGTYAGVRHGHTGLLFNDTTDLLTILDALVANPDRCQALARNAHSHVAGRRLLEHHAPRQLAFYRRLVARAARAAPAVRPPELEGVAALNLPDLRQGAGWRQLGARHWRRNLEGPAELAFQAGQEAMQQQQWHQALDHFRQASATDPGDPYALVFLGLTLERLLRPDLAQRAFERAAALDPLSSRPPRALAALHRRQANHWAAIADQRNPLMQDLPSPATP